MQPNPTSRQKFTPQEDALLKHLVDVIHVQAWQDVAKHIPGRTARQCRDRYNIYLSPARTSESWSAVEDLTIIKAYNTLGAKWSLIASFLPGRNCVQVKNRWYHHIARQPKPQQTFEADLERFREEERQRLNEEEKICTQSMNMAEITEDSVELEGECVLWEGQSSPIIDLDWWGI
jgi:hypothetical protein